MAKNNKRQQVYDKYNGLCAYTGKLLGSDWQIDHVISKAKFTYNLYCTCSDLDEIISKQKDVDRIENLVPALRIVNHYKRSLDLEGFRAYMKTFHKRLAKLPKRSILEKTAKRKQYMTDVANAFDITLDKPFSGVFYFETLIIKEDTKDVIIEEIF